MLAKEFEQQGLSLFRWRSYWPLVALALAVWIVWLRPNPYPALAWPALALGLLGLLIRIATVGYTPKNTSGRNTAEGQVAESINTQGMYSLDLGNFLMWLAPALLTGHGWFILVFTLAFWLYYERIMFAEEQFLFGKFGSEYQNWAQSRPAFLPRSLTWHRPGLGFCWKNVLKKEKNGLAALLLVMAGIRHVERCSELGFWVLPEADFWNLAALISTLLCVVLKLIKKYSSWLDEAGR